MRTQILLTTAVLLVSAPLFAQKPALSQDAIAEADRRFDEGRKLYNDGKYEEALVRFREACAAHRTEHCPKNIGLAEEKLAKWTDAATHLREYLDDPGSKNDPTRSGVEERYRSVLAHVASITIDAPEGAVVTIDTQSVGRAPLGHEVFVAAGSHEYVARLGDKETNATSVATEGATGSVKLAFPDTTQAPKTDSYRPTVGYVVPIALAGIGVVGIVVGAVFGAASSATQDERLDLAKTAPCADRTSAACTAYADKVDSQSSSSTASVVGYVVGATFLAGAVVSFLVWPKSERAIQVTPTASTDGFGLFLRGRF
ncbi:hypothetical protein BH09MYX1_BH09MYX1_13380 [soil metagenome]